MGPREFLSKLSGVAGVNLMEKLAGLVLGVLLVRWLGAEDYGRYAFVMACVTLGMIGTVIGMPQWLLRELASGRDRPEELAGGRVQQRVLTLIAASGAVWIVVGSSALLLLAEPGPLRAALLVALWLLAANALLVTLGHALRAWSMEVRAQVVSSLVPTVGTAALIGAMYWSPGIDGSPALAVAARGAVVVGALGIAAVLLLRITRPPATARSCGRRFPSC